MEPGVSKDLKFAPKLRLALGLTQLLTQLPKGALRADVHAADVALLRGDLRADKELKTVFQSHADPAYCPDESAALQR